MSKIIDVFIVFVFLISCNQDYLPKPAGYFRIDFPEKKYQVYNSECPYKFEYPIYFNATKSDQANAEPCWLNLSSASFKSKIHLSYKNVSKTDINIIIEECRNLVYKHDIKADAIDETVYSDTINKIFGTLYEIKGNAASNIQFYLTDSVEHFVRGALYFEVKPNKDSLAPVINFIKQDVKHLIETLRWE